MHIGSGKISQDRVYGAADNLVCSRDVSSGL